MYFKITDEKNGTYAVRLHTHTHTNTYIHIERNGQAHEISEILQICLKTYVLGRFSFALKTPAVELLLLIILTLSFANQQNPLIPFKIITILIDKKMSTMI